MGRAKKNKTLYKNSDSKVTKIGVPLIQLILEYQTELQRKESLKNPKKPKQITFIHASIQLEKEFKRNKK